MQIRCPKCHEASTDPDYCSECGAAISQAPAPSPASNPPASAGGTSATTCPDCAEPRPGPQARFCDTCRYDFVSSSSFSAAQPDPVAPAPVQAPVAPAPAAAQVSVPAADPAPRQPDRLFSVGSAVRWEFTASVNRSQLQPGDPEPPVLPDRVFPVDFEENLIGRRSDKDGIHPEISLTPDGGVSKKHAKVTRDADGALMLLDLDSMNGTSLNGIALKPNVLTPLADGDVVTLGGYTSLVLRRR